MSRIFKQQWQSRPDFYPEEREGNEGSSEIIRITLPNVRFNQTRAAPSTYYAILTRLLERRGSRSRTACPRGSSARRRHSRLCPAVTPRPPAPLMTPMPRLAARKPARVCPSSLHAWGVRGRPHAVLRRADTLAPCYRRVSPGTRTHPQELVPAAPRGGRGAETGSGSCAWILLFFLSFVFIYLFIFLMRKGSMWPQVSLDTALCVVVWSLA